MYVLTPQPAAVHTTDPVLLKRPALPLESITKIKGKPAGNFSSAVLELLGAAGVETKVVAARAEGRAENEEGPSTSEQPAGRVRKSDQAKHLLR